MFWKVCHDTLKWLGISFFPLIGFIFTAGLGIAQTFPEQKPWLTERFDWFVAMLSDGFSWGIIGFVFIAWLAALLWSGHKVVQAETRPAGDTYNVHGSPGGHAIGRVDNLQLGQRRFELTDDLVDQLADGLRARWPGLPIEVEGVGGVRSNEVATQLAAGLRQRGFVVHGEVGIIAFYFDSQAAPIYSRLTGDKILISVDARIPM